MYAVTSKPCCTINGLLYFSSDTYGVLSSPQLQGVGKKRRGAAGLNDAPVPPLGHLSKTTFPVVNFAEIDIDANGGSHRRAVEKSEHDSVQYCSSYGYFQPLPSPFPCPKGPQYAAAPGLTPPSAVAKHLCKT
jgi:hypothetical protein